MTTIDARRLNCPQPLILTKNALEEGNNEVETIVDSQTAKENISKYCTKMGYKYEVFEKLDGYYINIKKNENEQISEKQTSEHNNNGKVYLIGTNILGNGSEELGKVLIKGFIYTLTQTKPYPKCLLFVNSGVKLTSEGSDVLDDLNKLLQCGTRIVSCGTCLDYYKLKDKLSIGEVTNMYDIVETITENPNVITLG